VPCQITITAEREENFWLISVKDNGIGIHTDMQKKVFDMFHRLNPREYAGTGIGLTICQRIVELHGGRMWCESAENDGASFFFTLPAYDEGQNQKNCSVFESDIDSV
jgi:signal transduction histidine kinase